MEPKYVNILINFSSLEVGRIHMGSQIFNEKYCSLLCWFGIAYFYNFLKINFLKLKKNVFKKTERFNKALHQMAMKTLIYNHKQ